MRAGPLFLAPCALLALALTLGACGDSTGIGARPEVVEDTILLAAPLPANADVPSALDVTPAAFGATIGGGRFPERPTDAEQWDVAVRVRDGELVLAPPAALGFTTPSLRRAAITDPITSRSFAAIEEAPPASSFAAERAVPLRAGAVYVLRSRFTPNGCTYFAKVEPVEIDRALERVRLHYLVSTFCGDTRLTRED